ncbi:MAG TPA: polysaccharide biosynthesis/export family protein, partial [Burkholderiaceae bacterium]|nr:polysaccharide biosynthesis/export family protein [Burkholderiaceae bacterium]
MIRASFSSTFRTAWRRCLLALFASLFVLFDAAGAARAQSHAVPAEYRLGAGDVVRVTVYQNPDLTLEARVSEAGQVSYPLLGNVRLGGLTVSEA